jgi:nucleotide-binding universal stress UspA family protein
MKVLLAIDDSLFSSVATDTLIAQVKTEGIEIRVLHVLEPFPKDLAEVMGSKEHPDFAFARLKLRERAKELVAKAARKLERAGFKVSSLIEEGDARSAILYQAEIWDADLIVLGSHGRTGLGRFLVGSVSEAVARHARCSVQIVRARSAT